jgi:hypothetical protein
VFLTGRDVQLVEVCDAYSTQWNDLARLSGPSALRYPQARLSRVDCKRHRATTAEWHVRPLARKVSRRRHIRQGLSVVSGATRCALILKHFIVVACQFTQLIVRERWKLMLMPWATAKQP